MLSHTPPKFCSRCGALTKLCVPPGDNRERAVCGECDFIFYSNPRPVAAAIVTNEQGQMLLCRRAIEPRVGYWTAPGGYQEVGESSTDAAARETMEEAGAEIRIDGLHAVLDLPFLGQSYAIYRATLLSGYSAGVESQEVQLFDMDQLPWEELAFPVLGRALRWYADETRTGQRNVHVAAINWDGSGDRWDPERYTVEGHQVIPIGS
ncbi:MAG: ADP-ribose pyrophosphatase YjhB (NUDIX family) [Planctomycetota bacterium]|jgi:ADP-ribose pyrophosphatase YjhB (NUDIX family)